MDPVPSLERVTVVRVNPDVSVHLIHSLFSVRVDLYLTHRRLFSCLVELPAEGLDLVVEIPNKFFSVRRSICGIPHVDHVTHLGGI